MYFYEILNDMDMKGVSLGKRLYVIKHFILFSEITKTTIKIKKIRNLLNKFLVSVLYIPGKIKSKKYIEKYNN